MGSGARNGVKSKYLTFAGSRLDAEVSVSFQDALSQHRLLAFTPQLRVMRDAVVDRAAVWFFATRNGARDADELSAHLIGRQSDLCVAVSAQIDELEVRSQIRVRERPGALQVEALCIFQAGTDAVLQQHVEGPVRLRPRLLVRKKQWAERSVLRKSVLIRFHDVGTNERRTYVTQADRVELAGRKFRRRVSGPETVAIARDNGEAGDLRVAHKTVDFSALCVRAAEVTPAQRRVSAVFRPRL